MPVHYRHRTLRGTRDGDGKPDRARSGRSGGSAARRSAGCRMCRRLAESDELPDSCPQQVEREGRAVAQQARTEARLSLNALRALIERLGAHRGSEDARAAVRRSCCRAAVGRPDVAWCCGAGGARDDSRAPARGADAGCLHGRLSPTLQRRYAAPCATALPVWLAARRVDCSVSSETTHIPSARILKELSGHYLVAFEAADPDRDGRVHPIAVKVSGPRVTIRARPVFQFTPAASSRHSRHRAGESAAQSPAGH